MRAALITLASWSCILAPGCGDSASPDSGCPWYGGCAEECAGCDDGDPATSDRCLFGAICGYRPVVPACVSACGSPGELAPIQSLTQGQGGLAGLAGVRDLAVTADGERVYTVGDGGIVSLLLMVDDRLLPVSSTTVTGDPTRLAVLGDRLLAVGSATLAMGLDHETGALDGDATAVGGPAGAVTVQGDTVAIASATRLELYDESLTLLATADGVHAGGLVDLAFAPDSVDLYGVSPEGHVAGWRRAAATLLPVALLSGEAGLAAASGLAVSNDGETIFVAGFCDHDIAILERDPASGGLKYRGSAHAGDPLPGCDARGGDEGNGEDELLFEHPYRAFPTAIAVRPSDGAVILTSFLGDRASVYRADQAGGLTRTATLSKQPHYLDFDVETEDQISGGSFATLRGWGRAVGVGDRVFATSRLSGTVRVVQNEATAQLVQHGDGGVDSLPAAYNLDLSPDGRHLYVAARNHGNLAAFAAAPDTGGLTQLATTEIPNPHPFARALTRVRVSPDGGQVLAVDAEFSTVEILDRDAEGGELSHTTSIPLGPCVDRPSFPVDVVLAPDGTSVYVADFHFEGASCLWHFQRDGAGVLSAAMSVRTDDVVGGVESITLSADGRHLYTAAHVGAAATRFLRDPSTGLLSEPAAIVRTDLAGAEFIALTPDERHVYVTSPMVNTLVAFARDAEDGTLTWIETLNDGGPLQITDAAGIVISPSGDTVFVAARVADSITSFRRAADGRLTPIGRVDGLPSLDWVNGLAISPDGRHLYAAAVKASAVTALRVVIDGGDGCGAACP